MVARQRLIPDSYRRFLRGWWQNPFAVGALAPSGRPLARLMASEIAPHARVVELGPGTGTLTREILRRGVSPSNLYLVERCAEFAELLGETYPEATVVRGDATLPLDPLLPHRGTIDVIVSGLPLVLFTREQRERLLLECAALLKPGGALYQFTYGGRCPLDRRQLNRHGLSARCIGFIARNMPPAFVYRITARRTAR